LSVSKIEVMEERTIGRHFQAAALGVILGSLPLSLQDKILEGFEIGEIILEHNEASLIINNITSILKTVCNVKRAAPTLYRAGRGDTRILSMLAPSLALKGSLCDWLIAIGQNVLQYANTSVPIPMFLRSYVFSKYRDVGEVEMTNAISLYSATAGAVISVIASDLRRGEARYELYIVPDTSLESIRNSSRIYAILHAQAKGIRNLETYIRDLLRVESLSFELTMLLSIALFIYNVTTQVAGMPPLTGLYNVFEKFKIISVVPEQRPRVVWERPLTLTYIFEELDRRGIMDILLRLYWCADHAVKYSESVTRAGDVVSQCVTALFAYIETKSLDQMLACVANTQRLIDKFNYLCKSEGDKNACNAERDFAVLNKDIVKLVA